MGLWHFLPPMNAGVYELGAALFCFSAFLIVYTYAIYPALLLAVYIAVQAARDVRYLVWPTERRAKPAGSLPQVTVVIPVFNEAERLRAKLANLRDLDYPSGKLKVLFVSDGSTDGTNRLLETAGWPNLELLALPERKGKANALNQAMRRVSSDIVIFCDASTLIPLDGIRKLVRHFDHPGVGLVSTNLRLVPKGESAATEGRYWRFEMTLRTMEARLGVVLCATGPLYAIRRECYRPLAINTLVDDLVTTLRVRHGGWRTVFDPEIEPIDHMADTVAGEFKRRVRLAEGSFRAIPEMIRTRAGICFWIAFLSHKVLRWLLPLPLAGLLIGNVLAAGNPVLRLVLAAQIAFYALAALGYVRRGAAARKSRLLLAPYYILALHTAFVIGFFKSLAPPAGSGAWERVT